MNGSLSLSESPEGSDSEDSDKDESSDPPGESEGVRRGVGE